MPSWVLVRRRPRPHSHPAGFWSSASGLLASSEQPGSTPGLNLPHTAIEGSPPREPQLCLERKGGAGSEHRGTPTTFLARVLPPLPAHSWGSMLPPLSGMPTLSYSSPLRSPASSPTVEITSPFSEPHSALGTVDIHPFIDSFIHSASI